MLRRTKKQKELVINIDGPDGNAFFLIGSAMQYAKDLGFDKDLIREEMTKGDYIHLLKTFMKYFPMVVLETTQEDLLNELEA